MGALAALTKWIPEDDLLLKNAVEAGASLESLAKGAVHFSRRYTLKEIYGRWRKLLYDPDTSTEASARIIELETEINCSNPPKPYRTSLFRGRETSGKRKGDNVRNQYFALRKRICCEPHGSDDSGFPTQCDSYFFRSENTEFQQHFVHRDECLVGFDSADKSHGWTESYLGFYKGLRVCDNMEDCFPGMLMVDYADCKDNSVDFLHTKNMDNLGDELLGGVCISECPQSEEQCALRNFVYEAESIEQLPRGDNNEDGSIKAVPEKPSSSGKHVRVHPEFANVVDFNDQIVDCRNQVDELRQAPEECFPCTGNLEANQVTNTLIVDDDDVKDKDSQQTYGADLKTIVNIGVSEGELNISRTLGIFEDFSSSYINFEVDVLLSDVDEKGSSFINHQGEMMPHDDVVNPSESQLEGLNEGSGDLCGKAHDESDVLGQAPSDHVDDDRSGVGFDMLATSLNIYQEAAIDEGFVCCMINTEDPEIPCNDHIFPSGTSEDLEQNLVGKDAEIGFSNEEYEASFLRSDSCLMPSGAAMEAKSLGVDDSNNFSVCDPTVNELTGAALTDLKKEIFPLLVSGKLVNNGISNNKSSKRSNSVFIGKTHHEREADSHVKHPRCVQSNLERRSQEMLFMDSGEKILNPDQEGILSESEDDVPNFSDIEAMILENDLDPNDQDSSIYSKEAARYQCADARKSLIRLEQGSLSYMRRAFSSHGALAVLYGRRLKYYIRTPKVLLGRATEAVKVDIDLGREGRANAISRRQAIITMEEDGTFFLTNMGKCSIFIDNREVPKQKRINLVSGCLIEIRGMRFIFEVNQGRMKAYPMHYCRIKKETSKKFEWTPGAVDAS